MGNKTMGGDDKLLSVMLNDFSGGLNSMDGSFTVGQNQCLIAGTQNVIGFPGRCIYAGGFTSVSTMPTKAVDSSWQFFDGSRKKHWMVWANGNLYDCVSGAAVVIATAVYTPGQQIGRVDQQGVLYFCTDTVPVTKWDAVTVTQIPGAPTGTCMTSFAGSLLVGNPTPAGYARQPGAFIPSAVNDPTVWLPNLMQQSGTSFGGEVSFILPMGVTAAGVPASKSIIVGMTAGNMYEYSGPVGQQNQVTISCPVGCFDPNSAVYVPSTSLYGEVMFLGTDGHLWTTNGLIADLVSPQNLNYVFNLVSTARANNPNQRFSATYNNKYGYYLIDTGSNFQLLYRWKTKALWIINGWPSGAMFSGTSSTGFGANFVASDANYATAGLYQLGVDNATFGGANPTISYQAAYLSAGNPELDKDWLWAALGTRNLGLSYTVSAKGMPDCDNYEQVSDTLTFNDPADVAGASGGAAGTLIWDVGEWDANNWAATSVVQQTPPQLKHGMLAVTVPIASFPWVLPGTTEILRSPAVSPTISWNNDGNSAPNFDICALNLRYLPGSMATKGGLKYAASDGVPLVGNDWWKPALG